MPPYDEVADAGELPTSISVLSPHAFPLEGLFERPPGFHAATGIDHLPRAGSLPLA